jgi:hypothetical protein
MIWVRAIGIIAVRVEWGIVEMGRCVGAMGEESCLSWNGFEFRMSRLINSPRFQLLISVYIMFAWTVPKAAAAQKVSAHRTDQRGNHEKHTLSPLYCAVTTLALSFVLVRESIDIDLIEKRKSANTVSLLYVRHSTNRASRLTTPPFKAN